MSLGSRLKEERERLDLSQVEFREACGASKTAQFYFENDRNLPGAAYLIAADALGVDVLYVLTGRRGRPISPNVARASKQGVAIIGAHNSVTVNAAPKRRSRK